MPEAADLIAIVRYGQDASAVWHVDVTPSTPIARLCGAWVTDDVNLLRKVVAARIIQPFGGQLEDPATEFAGFAAGVVCHAASAAAVTRVKTRADATGANRFSLGDIGTHFPDTDERYKGADSLELLRSAMGLLSASGFDVVNVDATVVIEKPIKPALQPAMA